MKPNKNLLLAMLAVISGATFTSCQSPTGNGAMIGAGLGAVGGYMYDRHDKRDDGDAQRWDRERVGNVAKGTAIGAGTGAVIGHFAAPRQQGYAQQPYAQQQFVQPGYPQQGYYPQR